MKMLIYKLLMNTKLSLLLLYCGFTCLVVNATQSESNVKSRAWRYFAAGQFTQLTNLSDSLAKAGAPAPVRFEADSLNEIASRIRLDFSLSEPTVEAQLRTRYGSFTLDEKKQWEQKDWLEYRIIDGQKRYFDHSVSNLKLRMNQFNDSANNRVAPLDSGHLFQIKHITTVVAQTSKPGNLTEPVGFTLNYTLTVKPDVVPAGEMIRCWLPYPKENRARQSDVKLVGASPSKYLLSSDSAGHRSIYVEQKAIAGKPVVFNVKFSYQGAAQYFDPDKMKIRRYDKRSALYRQYTSEQAPHIVFTPQIKALADQIVGKEKNPINIVRKLYEWIDTHIIWSSALEYSTMENISEYVLAHRRGDCGMQTLLFMTMARYKGIPAKWQSGWMLRPGDVNLHDWSEVYYEGTGWVPLDMSFGLQQSVDSKVHYYYMTGIDAYRFIVNDEISAPFTPDKQFLRSETVDFQRGEVEWRGGNLYFDKWNYKMEVDYGNKQPESIK
jgi:transglutaminase-like putative cysteine protease